MVDGEDDVDRAGRGRQRRDQRADERPAALDQDRRGDHDRRGHRHLERKLKPECGIEGHETVWAAAKETWRREAASYRLFLQERGSALDEGEADVEMAVCLVVGRGTVPLKRRPRAELSHQDRHHRRHRRGRRRHRRGGAGDRAEAQRGVGPADHHREPRRRRAHHRRVGGRQRNAGRPHADGGGGRDVRHQSRRSIPGTRFRSIPTRRSRRSPGWFASITRWSPRRRFRRTAWRTSSRMAKAKPSSVTYGTAGVGSGPHVNIARLQNVAGIQLVPVHYRGATPSLERRDGRPHQHDADQRQLRAAEFPRRPGQDARHRQPASGCRRCPTCRPSPKAATCRASSPGHGSAWRPPAGRRRTS